MQQWTEVMCKVPVKSPSDTEVWTQGFTFVKQQMCIVNSKVSDFSRLEAILFLQISVKA
jgi:hypothetical protein